MDTVKIKDICDVFDGPHATPTKTSDGPIYLGIDAITEDGKLNKSQFAHLSEDDYRIWTRRVTPQSGDIVFSYEATLGRYAIIPDGFYGCLGRRLAVIRNKSTRINTKWLYYYFRSPQWSAFINSNIVKGSTVNRISVEDFPEYSVPLLPKNVQDRIASILGNIDRKIEINSHINDNLQQMAYDTFMHSFFRKESNGKLGDIIVENAKSPIQVGDAKAANNGDIPFFTSGDAILKWPEALVTGRNCYLNTGGNADVKFYVGDAAYSTDTWCITASGGMSDYLYLLLLSIKPELNKKYFQGTGLKHLQKPMLKDRPIYIPVAKELETFNKTVQPWFNMIASNVKESQSLVALRDWLLPMLMNGQAVIED